MTKHHRPECTCQPVTKGGGRIAEFIDPQCPLHGSGQRAAVMRMGPPFRPPPEVWAEATAATLDDRQVTIHFATEAAAHDFIESL